MYEYTFKRNEMAVGSASAVIMLMTIVAILVATGVPWFASGFEVNIGMASWGLLASTGADTIDLYPWQLVFPAAMLAITLFCFNFLGDGLRDALDPRIRKD